jgi:hypothetical protein
MSRIEPPAKRSLVARIIHVLVRRKLGRVPTPIQVMAHHGGVLMAYARMEQAQLKADRVPRGLKLLAQVRTSTLIGCPY